MVSTVERRHVPAFHPVHLLLLGAVIVLFLGGLLSDIAYARTYEIQWQNFASWLIVGGLVFSAVAVLFSLFGLRGAVRTRGSAIYALVVVAMWVIGFFNALMHARDAWASMPGGLIMSLIVVVLALVATFMGFRTVRTGELK